MKKQPKTKSKEIENIKQLEGQLVRALADYDNLRKRTDLEKEVWLRVSTERIINKLLPILDALESAQKYLKDKGLKMLIADFKKILYDERLEEIKAKRGDKFDHNIHEVVEIAKGGNKGEISELIISGWKFIDGPVLRFAKVKVYLDKIEKRKN